MEETYVLSTMTPARNPALEESLVNLRKASLSPPPNLLVNIHIPRYSLCLTAFSDYCRGQFQ